MTTFAAAGIVVDERSLAVVLGVAGAAWGLVADRVGARWPAHEDGSVRDVDWRTLVVAVLGGASLAALPQRMEDIGQVLFFGGYFLALTLLLATDLDQRLLPDLVTLPLIAITLLAAVAGWNPLVAGQLGLAAVAALAIPGFLFAVSIPFGSGAIGMGDLKLLVSVGLLTGLERSVAGVVVGALVAGVVIAVLLALRRVTLRTYIPFGPFLIIGAFWAVLVRL
jgi:prepilin signal peptidase PulO-like enzyme (type II secretory pathway)